jgi:hypothetical protein
MRESGVVERLGDLSPAEARERALLTAAHREARRIVSGRTNRRQAIRAMLEAVAGLSELEAEEELGRVLPHHESEMAREREEAERILAKLPGLNVYDACFEVLYFNRRKWPMVRLDPQEALAPRFSAAGIARAYQIAIALLHDGSSAGFSPNSTPTEPRYTCLRSEWASLRKMTDFLQARFPDFGRSSIEKAIDYGFYVNR